MHRGHPPQTDTHPTRCTSRWGQAAVCEGCTQSALTPPCLRALRLQGKQAPRNKLHQRLRIHKQESIQTRVGFLPHIVLRTKLCRMEGTAAENKTAKTNLNFNQTQPLNLTIHWTMLNNILRTRSAKSVKTKTILKANQYCKNNLQRRKRERDEKENNKSV